MHIFILILTLVWSAGLTADQTSYFKMVDLGGNKEILKNGSYERGGLLYFVGSAEKRANFEEAQRAAYLNALGQLAGSMPKEIHSSGATILTTDNLSVIKRVEDIGRTVITGGIPTEGTYWERYKSNAGEEQWSVWARIVLTRSQYNQIQTKSNTDKVLGLPSSATSESEYAIEKSARNIKASHPEVQEVSISDSVSINGTDDKYGDYSRTITKQVQDMFSGGFKISDSSVYGVKTTFEIRGQQVVLTMKLYFNDKILQTERAQFSVNDLKLKKEGTEVSEHVGRGVLVINSTPKNARVIIDGRTRGETDLKISGLAYGSFEIEVSLQGYESVRSRVTIGKEPVYLNYQLKREVAIARISSKPESAEVKSQYGNCRTPCELKVPSGVPVSISLSKRGYYPLNQIIVASSVSGDNFSYELSGMLVPVTFHVEPKDAEIYVGTEKVLVFDGEARTHLQPGLHQISISANGYQSKRFGIKVEPEKSVNEKIKLDVAVAEKPIVFSDEQTNQTHKKPEHFFLYFGADQATQNIKPRQVQTAPYVVETISTTTTSQVFLGIDTGWYNVTLGVDANSNQFCGTFGLGLPWTPSEDTAFYVVPIGAGIKVQPNYDTGGTQAGVYLSSSVMFACFLFSGQWDIASSTFTGRIGMGWDFSMDMNKLKKTETQ